MEFRANTLEMRDTSRINSFIVSIYRLSTNLALHFAQIHTRIISNSAGTETSRSKEPKAHLCASKGKRWKER